ncbi:hypothetical protein O6H91_02G078500 [Diphasiastrum complanatum]|uniref:Uncharacterized protein n=1 Tax=Diphasiastrum complanatum TaxID=34168 RepID=A0ACC2EHI2_DIPCM|nr:hypothetical protein O6H91_02G078500 [Diphasiastrum complanatum]
MDFGLEINQCGRNLMLWLIKYIRLLSESVSMYPVTCRCRLVINNASLCVLKFKKFMNYDLSDQTDKSTRFLLTLSIFIGGPCQAASFFMFIYQFKRVEVM